MDENKTLIKLKCVRTSYLYIFEARAKDAGSEPRYSGTFLIPKTDRDQIDLVKAAIEAAKEAKWGNKAPRIPSDKLCLRSGDGEQVKDEDREIYANHAYVAAGRAADQPRMKVKDRDGKTNLTAADGKPYSGCYVNVWLRIWAQDNQYGKRINACIEGVQFVKDGEAFGARPLSDDVFENLEDDDDSFKDEAPTSRGKTRTNGAAASDESFADI